MKYILSSLIVLFVACKSQVLKKQKPIDFSYSEIIKDSSQYHRNDSIKSNHIIIELFTGTHPLRNEPLTKKAGVMDIIPRKTYSFLILEINWKKCKDGWLFSNCNLLDKGGEMLNLYSIKLDNVKFCQNGRVLIKAQISPLTIGKKINSEPVFYLNDSIISDTKFPNKSTSYRGFFLDIMYHFDSNSLTNEAFLFNPEIGDKGFFADGVFEVRDLILSHDNTISTGDIINEIESVTEKGLKIAIWDKYLE